MNSSGDLSSPTRTDNANDISYTVHPEDRVPTPPALGLTHDIASPSSPNTPKSKVNPTGNPASTSQIVTGLGILPHVPSGSNLHTSLAGLPLGHEGVQEELGKKAVVNTLTHPGSQPDAKITKPSEGAEAAPSITPNTTAAAPANENVKTPLSSLCCPKTRCAIL